MVQIHDTFYQKWIKKQPENKIFEWGGLSDESGAIAVHIRKEFNDMTEDEKEFQFQVFCHSIINKHIDNL
jgi:hypothetical protein